MGQPISITSMYTSQTRNRVVIFTIFSQKLNHYHLQWPFCHMNGALMSDEEVNLEEKFCFLSSVSAADGWPSVSAAEGRPSVSAPDSGPSVSALACHFP